MVDLVVVGGRIVCSNSPDVDFQHSSANRDCCSFAPVNNVQEPTALEIDIFAESRTCKTSGRYIRTIKE